MQSLDFVVNRLCMKLFQTSVGPRADPGVQAISPLCILSYPSGGLSLLSARPAVTFPDEERHCPLTSTKLYCLVTETHRCEQFV